MSDLVGSQIVGLFMQKLKSYLHNPAVVELVLSSWMEGHLVQGRRMMGAGAGPGIPQPRIWQLPET